MLSPKSEIHVDYISDVELAGLKSRDGALLKATFLKINPVLFRVLAANGVFSEVAEDLVHQTWEKFFTNLDLYEGRSTLQTFICGILINKIREHRRSSQRIVFEEDSEAVMAHTFSSDGWWNREPTDPSALVQASQVSKLIHECLEGLTELQRSAFIMKEVDQEESPEICNVLDVSVSHLRVLIYRAKDKLRQCLEGKVGFRESQ